MTCTAQSRMTLEEQLAKAEDCVKFDEVYYKLLGEDTRYHLWVGWRGVSADFQLVCIYHLSLPHCTPGRWTRSYATVPCIANPKVKPGGIPIFFMRALRVVGSGAVTRKWVNLH